MKASIRFKFSTFLACLLVLTIGILSLLVLQGVKTNQKNQYEDYLSRQSNVANIYIRQTYLQESIKEPSDFINIEGPGLANDIGNMIGMKTVIYNSQKREIGNSMPFSASYDASDLVQIALTGKTVYETDDDLLIYVFPVYGLKGPVGAVQFNYSLKQNINFYNGLKKLFLITGFLILISSFAAGYIYYNRFADQILKLKKITDEIKKGNFGGFSPFKRSDELGELSRGIYFMSGQIQENIGKMNMEQEKLKLAVKKLETLEMQQKDFIGNITHEFKTPLTAIKAYSDLLEMYPDDPELLKDARANISKETKRLYEMVEKTLYLSSLEKYDFETHMDKLETSEILKDICSRMNGRIQKFGLKLNTSFVKAEIYADKESFTEIFVNLLDNAIKYNVRGGKVWVNSRVEGNSVLIEVKDTGIGIPDNARDKIFEPFYTVNKDRSRQYGGVGLGLSLVKKLVEKQKGVIKLLDEPENGTVFLIEFPKCS